MGQAPPPARPNIIFILADDLGYGDLGCYGQQRIKTPNLDRLAAEGMRFTSCYAGSSVSAPSRAGLMTGQHTGHGWIRGEATAQGALRATDLTVAEMLQTTSYKTGAIGKWTLGDEGSTGEPNKKGFSDWFGYLTQSQANHHFPAYLSRNGQRLYLEANGNGVRGAYSDDLFTGAALNYIRINVPDKHLPHQRFFLYLAYTLPHANGESMPAAGNGMEVPSDEPYSNEPWPPAEKNKAAMITRLDKDVGRILDRLKEFKAETNTVIFFSSGNGPHHEGGVNPEFQKSAGPLRGGKGDLYEGGIRVPMIVRWPGTVKAGSVSDFPWAFWDFLPTAAELAGINPPEKLDGLSILPTLLGQPQTPHPFFYWETHENGFQQAVRMGDWKALRPAPDKAWELYDLKQDLGERHNVADKNRKIIKLIDAYVKTARTESELWPVEKAKSSGKTK